MKHSALENYEPFTPGEPILQTLDEYRQVIAIDPGSHMGVAYLHWEPGECTLRTQSFKYTPPGTCDEICRVAHQIQKILVSESGANWHYTSEQMQVFSQALAQAHSIIRLAEQEAILFATLRAQMHHMPLSESGRRIRPFLRRTTHTAARWRRRIGITPGTVKEACEQRARAFVEASWGREAPNIHENEAACIAWHHLCWLAEKAAEPGQRINGGVVPGTVQKRAEWEKRQTEKGLQPRESVVDDLPPAIQQQVRDQIE